MEISSAQVSRIFKSYQNQARIAELNKKANIKSVQKQVDRVDISVAARRLAVLHSLSGALRAATGPTDASEPVDREEQTGENSE